ncbi:MAG: hypothetical protein HY862_06240 [Chloroflexi bacterium]|nr:hypothetical protein [Chloroflexota bacterium]
MPEILEEHYQENGFELVIYRQRQPDSYRTCQQCGRHLFHVASVFDEWGEAQSATTLYHYCKHCKTIEQHVTRQQPSGANVQQNVFSRAPYSLLVELLATARHQNGRGVTVLTINRHWWSAWRYRLVMGTLLGPDTPRVRPLSIPGKSSNTLVDQETRSITPIPRYNPQQVEHNPFKSRRVKRPDEVVGNGETTEIPPDSLGGPNSVEDEV